MHFYSIIKMHRVGERQHCRGKSLGFGCRGTGASYTPHFSPKEVSLWGGRGAGGLTSLRINRCLSCVFQYLKKTRFFFHCIFMRDLQYLYIRTLHSTNTILVTHAHTLVMKNYKFYAYFLIKKSTFLPQLIIF